MIMDEKINTAIFTKPFCETLNIVQSVEGCPSTLAQDKLTTEVE